MKNRAWEGGPTSNKHISTFLLLLSEVREIGVVSGDPLSHSFNTKEVFTVYKKLG